MASSEGLILVLSLGIALWVWVRWFLASWSVTALASGQALRRPLRVVPPACLLALFLILKVFASFDVRDDGLYLFFYTVMGAAWVGLAAALFPFLGVSARDDVLERGNRAAVWPVVGGLVGSTLCFAGGNIGDGPGWWVVVFSGFLSTGALLGLWAIAEALARLSDAVTVERDTASGLRLGAFLAAAGLVLGRSVAGDWHSAGQTLADFVAAGWPAAALALILVVSQRASRPTADLPARHEGSALVPCFLMLSLAVLWVVYLGGW